MALKPLGHGPGERTVSAMDVINRLRPKIERLPVASAFLQPVQDLRIGGRSSSALYQYTIQSDNIPDLAKWGPILLEHMRKLSGLQDVNTDQQNGGLEEMLDFDRVTAARLGQTPQSLDSALYSAFGQSEVSVIYTQLNQYYVVMEVAPQYWQSPGGAERHLVHHHWGILRRINRGHQHDFSAVNCRSGARGNHAFAGQPHRPVPVGDSLLQHGQWSVAQRRGPRGEPDGIGPRHAGDGAWLLRRHSAGVSGFAGLGEVSGHRPPSSRSTSFSAFSMRAWCIHSRSSPRCRRPALEPCWRS